MNEIGDKILIGKSVILAVPKHMLKVAKEVIQMPLSKGKKNVSRNISELHKGPRYKANVKKFGKKKANKIAVAAALSASRRGKKK